MNLYIKIKTHINAIKLKLAQMCCKCVSKAINFARMLNAKQLIM